MFGIGMAPVTATLMVLACLIAAPSSSLGEEGNDSAALRAAALHMGWGDELPSRTILSSTGRRVKHRRPNTGMFEGAGLGAPFEQLSLEGMRGRRHQEGGVAAWQDVIVIAGGFNVTYEEASRMPMPQILELVLGSHRVSIYNVSEGSFRDGPPLPIPMNHNAAAMDSQGRLHVIGGSTYLRPDLGGDTSSHYVWQFNLEGSGGWEARAAMPGSVGAHACEHLGGKIYCFGGALKASKPVSNQTMVSAAVMSGGRWLGRGGAGPSPLISC